jgi:hypothetical protein
VKKEEEVFGDLVLEEAIYLSSDSPRDDDKLHLFRLTQLRFILNCCLYECATRFGLYLGYPQACQYKSLTEEDRVRIKWPLVPVNLATGKHLENEFRHT